MKYCLNFISKVSVYYLLKTDLFSIIDALINKSLAIPNVDTPCSKIINSIF